MNRELHFSKNHKNMNLKIVKVFLVAIVSLSNHVIAQNYIDTVYTIATESNIVYGSATNFAGESINLEMDVSYPTNDNPPSCGRPLVILIHGGAWITGSKNESFISALRQDFAKRGYVAVAINYRLGFFQTNISKNCNIPNWNCMNVADSAEWTRALYRGVQDAHGAIRYMVINELFFNIDPSNIYVVGESAGAFIAMGVGYMDDESEKPTDCGTLASVLAPHQNYYAPCIQNSQFDISITQMNLSRPDLGPVTGTMNPTTSPYIIKGVGAFYGGMYSDLFTVKTSNYNPVLYMFHQPNDLIVPIGKSKLLAGYNACAMTTNCVNIEERRTLFGSGAISNLVDTLNIPISHKPQILFQTTNNNSDCFGQFANPATGGHQLDSYWTRNLALATFFAPTIDTNDCNGLGIEQFESTNQLLIFPNPNNGSFTVNFPKNIKGESRLEIKDLSGRVQYETRIEMNENSFAWEGDLKRGVYFLKLEELSSKRIFIQKFNVY
jgi:hypothetical protein